MEGDILCNRQVNESVIKRIAKDPMSKRQYFIFGVNYRYQEDYNGYGQNPSAGKFPLEGIHGF
jgi:hypothetical protein